MKLKLLALTNGLLLTPLLSQTINVDLGREDLLDGDGTVIEQNTTPGNYNNMTDSGQIILIDDSGANTGLRLLLDTGRAAGAAADYSGPFPAAVASQPLTALQDSLFIADRQGTGRDDTFTIRGLASDAVVDLVMYGARGSDSLGSIWVVEDGNGVQTLQIANIQNNSTQVVRFEDLIPDEDGEIFIDFTSSVGSSGSAAFNYLGITIGVPDSDGDGMTDIYETENNLDNTRDDTGDDRDEDGLTNLQEFLGQDANGTITNFGRTLAGNRDSDGDNLFDLDEVSGAMNSYDSSGALVVAPAVGAPTNPNVRDSDGDTLSDFAEVTDGNGFFTDPNSDDTDDWTDSMTTSRSTTISHLLMPPE